MSRRVDEARVVDTVAKQLFIGGTWVDATGARTSEVIDPATRSDRRRSLVKT